MDWRGLLFALCASMATAALFGLFPALSASRANLNEVLKGASRRTVRGAADRFRRMLTVAEVALAFVLLAGAGLLIRSFIKLQSVDKGFGASSIVTMGIRLDARYNQPERQTAFFRSLIERTSALAGVKAAAAINYLPLAGRRVSPTAFKSKGSLPTRKHYCKAAPLRRTTSPPWAFLCSLAEISPIAIRPAHHWWPMVSRNFAKAIFSGPGRARKRLRQGDHGQVTTIVGVVVGDVRHESLESAPLMQI